MPNSKSPLTLFAHIVSDLFAPLLIPTYAMLVAIFATYLAYIPLTPRLWATLGVFVITCVIPFAFIWTLIRMGKVSDASISDRKQRFIPYTASIVCYLGAALYVWKLNAPGWLTAFFIGAAIVSALSMFITRYWKISAHVGASAGLCAALFYLAWQHLLLSGPLVWVCIGIALVGIMAWSRLWLERHTFLQTLAGATLGFGIVLITLCI